MPQKTRSKPSAGRGGAAHKLTGITQPRLFPEPLRPLNRRTSRGYEVIDFAELIGAPLNRWQKWAVIHALEILPDGQYRFRIVLILVSRQNGKSHLKRIVSLWRMFMDDDCRLVLGTAQDVAQASYQWKLCLATIRSCWFLASKLANVRSTNGQESFTLTSGSEYKIRSANESAGRGLSVDELNIDELRTQKDWLAWAALSPTTSARPNPQIWCMSNAGTDSSVVLNQLRDSALSGEDPTIGLFEWSAPDGCDLDDANAWRQANPGLGFTVHEAALRTARAGPPAVFRTEHLCQRVDTLDGAIDMIAWRDCADPSGTMDGLRDRTVACFDMALDGQHCALAVAAVQKDGRPRVELAEVWHSSNQARAELAGWLDRIKPQAVGWYPTGPAAAFVPILRARPGSTELTGMKVAEACQNLSDLVRARRIIHAGQTELDAHLAGANKLPSGDGYRFVRKGGPSQGHVDAAYAAAGAVYLAQTLPPPQRARIRIIN
jgi:Phage Terminase